MNATRRAYLESFSCARPLLVSDDLAKRWDEESCLEKFSVRGLAGHLVRMGLAPLHYLAEASPDAAPVPGPQYYATVLSKMTVEDHAGVTTRGEDVAGASAQSLLADFDAAVEQLETVLEEIPEDRVVSVYFDVPVLIDDYLVTRIVEILVHTDDLAISLGLETPRAPRHAIELTIDHLIEVARARHGDRAVVTALTRRERDVVDALRIFGPVQKP